MKLLLYIPTVLLSEISYGAFMFYLGQKYRRVTEISIYLDKDLVKMQKDVKNLSRGDIILVFEGDGFQEMTVSKSPSHKKDLVYN